MNIPRGHIFLFALCIFSLSGGCTGTNYDVAIVGGGISGITAAYYLQDSNLKIILLEKEKHPGGRIRTGYFHGEPYEMGALFGFPMNEFPFLRSTKEIQLNAPIGISIKGNIIFGETPFDILNKLNFDQQTKLELKDAYWYNNFEKLPDNFKTVLNAFFGTIFPGKMSDYINDTYKFVLKVFKVSYTEGGNSKLVRQIISHLKIKVRTQAVVEGIYETSNKRLEVRYRKNGKLHTISSMYVILTVPAPEAFNLIKGIKIKNDIMSFLGSVKYYPGLSVIMFVKKNVLPNFSYIVFTSGKPKVIYKIPCTRIDCDKIYIYYDSKYASYLKDQTKDKLLKTVLSDLKTNGLKRLHRKDILFVNSHYWKYLAPLIDDTFYSIQVDGSAWVSENLIIAGEYAWAGKKVLKEIIPYGLIPAVKSGEKAANLLLQKLKVENK